MKRTFCRFCALLLIFGLMCCFPPLRTGAVTEEEIDALKAEREEIWEQEADVRNTIDSLEYKEFTITVKKEVLDEQMMLTQKEIDNTVEQIRVYDMLIVDKENEVSAAQAEEDRQWELCKTHLRAMEEHGTISYLAVIFDANSFVDLLGRLDMVSSAMARDRTMYNDLDAARLATIRAREDLEKAQQAQYEEKAALEQKREELAGQVEEAAALMRELEENIELQKAEYDALVQSEIELEQRLQETIAQYEAEQEALRRSSVTGTGSLIWPSNDSTYITDYFGWREVHPVYGTSRMHNGIDIGAAYGTDILAADGGVVLEVAYDPGGYGNYVFISHGNGLSTLYAHMSAVYVYQGQTVSQGETIGLVGMSGGVTGPHLHFEVWEGNTRVDPLNYFNV